MVDYLVSQQFIELTLSGSSRPTLESSTFPNSASLTDFVTRQWRANFVILLDASDPALDALSVRPFFLVVVIDAPLLTRWRRLLSVLNLRSTKHTKLTPIVPPCQLRKVSAWNNSLKFTIATDRRDLKWATGQQLSRSITIYKVKKRYGRRFPVLI